MKYTFLIMLTILATTISSCYKEADDDQTTPGKIVISFDNRINGDPLELNPVNKYTNPHGDDFRIEKFKYYISNVKLRNKKDHSHFTEAESYHLISPDQESHIKSFELEVPAGEYDLIEFSVGVDPDKNTSLSYDGDLDPNNSMAWDWEAGYKFLVMEGKYYTPATGSAGGGLVFHIGENKNYKSFALPLAEGSSGLKVSPSLEKTITVTVAIEEMWKAPHLINFNEVNEAMFGENASKIAENYSDGMFSIQKIN